MNVITVWRATTPEQNMKDRVENNEVVVTSSKPNGSERVLFELHVPKSALKPTANAEEFLFSWGDLDDYPYQVSHRN